MAAAPQSSFQMRSTDLIKKEPLDYGGFGDVYLCYHITLGQVVMKTMYTGSLRNEDSKRSLLEEGNIMASLNHERVVKLLGVIMEDRDCSLVMELIPRGNLLVMLENVPVPLSVKGRIIAEMLEGLVYLTQKRVIHKDIKPDNILVDQDFHIKIADLGLATYQTWSKLTKEESRRRSRLGQSVGVRAAGTLSYMAPEHLESIHTASTEKSDVYSFAIVVWVILTQEEPYANARSEDQISQCVRNGDRPTKDLIPADTPKAIIMLMSNCWHEDPQSRPTFNDGYSYFLPFYEENLQPHVEEDVLQLKKLYEGPGDLLEKIKSLSLTNDQCCSADGPAPLVSSDRSLSVPVEASIEDMHVIQCEVESIQADAMVMTPPLAAADTCDREVPCNNHSSLNPFLSSSHSTPSNTVKQPVLERPILSSVHSWSHSEPVQATSKEEVCCQPTSSYDSMISSASASSHMLMSVSCPSLDQMNQQHPHSHFDRQPSWPAHPVSDTSAPDMTTGRLLNISKSGLSQDPGPLFIHNARAIQIGSNNTMNIRGSEPYQSFFPNNSLIKEEMQKFEDYPVTEEHLDLLRENIGLNWKRCARNLGLTNVEVETIEHDYYRDGLPEMVHQMLEQWKMKEGSIGCTIGKLYQALEGKVKVEVFKKMLDTCASLAIPNS
ncbi:receptor-interacting serine/threonine-protein kinase 1 [Cynoglossus semilaevis]|uniref:Receptor (TNFRSF)-interacting serine-threonine kinase 1, like n=1 Tax=Cynoglossus semilaevis TaxID=244447 RepID=A0A3P8VM90_CYNSE|nr:receptor-interacting serine/threonine-protein kinase 1 [Cynoglossus semilaevis]